MKLFRSLGLALSAFAALGLGPWACLGPLHAQVGPPNQIQCNSLGTLAAGPTSITQIIAASSGKTVSICGWHVTNTGASGTFSFQYGTGTNCATGTTTFIPAVNVTSSAPSADHIEFAQISIPLSNAVCITPSVATISAIIFYTYT